MVRRPFLWFSLAVGVIVLAGVAAAGLTRHEPQCVRGQDTARPLNLASAEDRAHLERDLQDVRAAADAFSAAVAKRPLTTDSPDGIEGYRHAPERSRIWCEAILDAEVARTHGLAGADLLELTR